MNKTLIYKAVITFAIFAFLNLVFGTVNNATTAALAVNQLSDTYSSNQALQTYQHVKPFAWLAYPLVGILVFYKEIKSIFKGETTK